jgi:hypothetical protein
MILRLATALEKSLLWDNPFSFNERSRCFHSSEESGSRFSRVRAGLRHTHKNQCIRHPRRVNFVSSGGPNAHVSKVMRKIDL